MDRSWWVRGLASVGLAALVVGLVVTPRAVSSARTPKAPDGNAVLFWNATAGEAAVAACIAPTDNPLHESRMYAAMHIAIHDALNAIHRRYEPYALATRADLATASPEAAVASAARDVLVALLAEIPAPFPQACRDAGTDVAEGAYADALAAIVDGTAKTQGVRLGRAAAAFDPRRPHRGRVGHPAHRGGLPRGRRAGRVPLHP